MELKSLTWKKLNLRRNCFNCTFMELKSGCNHSSISKLIVLIVPLWNWNDKDTKEPVWIESVLIVPLWNWNKDTIADNKTTIHRFNCTFMELKCRSSIDWRYIKLCVLIVPLWNWNMKNLLSGQKTLKF